MTNTESPSYLISSANWPGLWNYQTLLLVHRQVNGRNPLAQPRFTCPKTDFFYFLKKTYVVGTHLKRRAKAEALLKSITTYVFYAKRKEKLELSEDLTIDPLQRYQRKNTYSVEIFLIHAYQIHHCRTW